MPTPTREKISVSTRTGVSRMQAEFLCHNKSVESLNLLRFSDDFVSSTSPQETQKPAKSTLIPPRFDITESAPQNISYEYNDDDDEYEKSSELVSEISFSARCNNNVVEMRENSLGESSQIFSEECDTRESILIIKEVITLDSSSDDDIQSLGYMKEGVANDSLEKAEYEKYLQLKEKYEGRRKPEYKRRKKPHGDRG